MMVAVWSVSTPERMWFSSPKLSVTLSSSSSSVSSNTVTVNVCESSPGAKTRFSGMPE